ncbi:MAG: nucleotidyltransferase domain-containing protein [Bacillota bacterium]|jgi:predicted nucleotidyltransferase|nr:nucleotidyltransferase domain-containing protein [Bacillota bacterium]
MEEMLQQIVEAIVDAVQPDRIILFGSRLHPPVDPSADYDILVLKRGVGNRRRAAQRIYLSLAHIPAPVDIIVEDPDHVDQYRDAPQFLYAEALRGRVLYER